jgi:hypothetical protein
VLPPAWIRTTRASRQGSGRPLRTFSALFGGLAPDERYLIASLASSTEPTCPPPAAAGTARGPCRVSSENRPPRGRRPYRSAAPGAVTFVLAVWVVRVGLRGVGISHRTPLWRRVQPPNKCVGMLPPRHSAACHVLEVGATNPAPRHATRRSFFFTVAAQPQRCLCNGRSGGGSPPSQSPDQEVEHSISFDAGPRCRTTSAPGAVAARACGREGS